MSIGKLRSCLENFSMKYHPRLYAPLQLNDNARFSEARNKLLYFCSRSKLITPLGVHLKIIKAHAASLVYSVFMISAVPRSKSKERDEGQNPASDRSKS